MGPQHEEEEAKGERKFVGLANQGATCYMNSLLQTLFMTPEFRRHIYMWRYNSEVHGSKDDSIPFQLQLLFCKLQLSQFWFAETTGLTKSFQWDTRESFQQHDVQEFCRVLFDAIEVSVKDTQQEQMINQLFEGVMVDYVKCEKCGYESQREDKYLDVSLAVRNEFDHIYNDSVEKALDNFVSVEHLTGENQYFCEKCQAKQDARKGLKFKNFPPIFMLQLKRFDLDYNTFQRIKINDKVTFPQVLNLNPYVNLAKPEYVQPPAEADAKDKEKHELDEIEAEVRAFNQVMDLDKRDFKYLANNRDEHISDDYPSQPTPMDYVAKKAHMDQKAAENRLMRHKDIARFRQEGENVYELFSILIHSGSALGGHYYSYIKSFAHDRWFIFNDSSVYEIEETEVEKAFGGEETKLWGNYTTSACAYLLVYRKVSPQNVNVIDDSEVPDYIMDSILHEKEKEEQEKKEKEEQKRIFSIRVYFQGKDKLISINKEELLSELKVKAIQEFQIADFTPENLRLRGYSPYQDTYQETYTGRDQQSIEALNIYNYKNMILETKKPEEEFEEYLAQGMSLKVSVWDDTIPAMENMTLAQKTVNAKRLQMLRDATLKQLLEKIEKITGLPPSEFCVMKRNYSSGPSNVEVISHALDAHKPLTVLKVYDGMTLFVEPLVEGRAVKWEEELERELYRYVIKFNHPDDAPSYWSQNDYKNSAIIDSRETVNNLKVLIGKLIKMDIDKFILKRGGKQGAEIKELELKISQSSLYNGGLIYVERGVPSRPDEFRICLSYAARPKPQASDSTLYEFTEIVEMPLSGNLTVQEAKDQICAKVISMYPSMTITTSNIRLRERNTERLSRVLRESDGLKNYTLYEKKQLCIQEFPEPVTELGGTDISLVVRKWSPSTWELTAPVEFSLTRYATFHQMGEVICEKLGVSLENLRAARIANTWNFSRVDLPTEQWFPLNTSSFRISSQPWYLTFDGNLIVVKDSEEPLKDLTDEDRAKFSNRVTSSSSTNCKASHRRV
jgi:ubiquitin C-terminal hydrolase